jgi:hypothetical protein
MTLHTYFTTLIQLTPPAQWDWMWYYVAVIAACFVLGIAVRFLPIPDGLKNRLGQFFWSNVFIGAFVWFCRWQAIPYFGSDLVRFIHEVSMILWLLGIAWYQVRTRPKERLVESVQERRAKYLPHP